MKLNIKAKAEEVEKKSVAKKVEAKKPEKNPEPVKVERKTEVQKEKPSFASTSAKATADKKASEGQGKTEVVKELPKMEAKKVRKEGEYTAKDISVLKGLEPVRLRPGMYIGGTGLDGLHHLIWEVVNNCLDEAIAGYAKNIEVVLLPENRVRISDDGRGIPVEKHPDTGKSTLETVLTTLHAGGKFGGEAYKVSGGLHGVGISVVCALSTYMLSHVERDGGIYEQEYFRGAPKGAVKKVGDSKKTGTTQTFDADPQIFSEIKYDAKKILNYLRQQAYLTKGVKITFSDERKKGEEANYTFYFEGGIASYVKYLVLGNTPRHTNVFSYVG